ncbi:MAG: CDP-glucose 4,6-dehydratase [Micavibrio sp.]|nr:MAG: CDP-glucose 4,6-dehydratase [Micavibrio sp.]
MSAIINITTAQISETGLPDASFWHGKRVLLTGHTGFKGSWLALWLARMGAEVHGIALDPQSSPNHFTLADIAACLKSDHRIDIRDGAAVQKIVSEIRPEIVFHLAAQPLVRLSYRTPIETLAVNVMGTAHVLEAIRQTGGVRVATMITTDKVYEDQNMPNPYREDDTLGGYDPYSASKGAAEIVISSYRRSFLDGNGTSVASARAGNVIGGGDWSEDRLIPDAVRAFADGKALELRKPDCVRPWQHVLDVLCGYMLLAEAQWHAPQDFARSWNFAPDTSSEETVGFVAENLARLWGGTAKTVFKPDPNDPKETALLRLDASLARMYLGWQSRWSIMETLENTVTWYRTATTDKTPMRSLSEAQIDAYCGIAPAAAVKTA